MIDDAQSDPVCVCLDYSTGTYYLHSYMTLRPQAIIWGGGGGGRVHQCYSFIRFFCFSMYMCSLS